MTKSLHSVSYASLLEILVAARHHKGLTQQAVANKLRKPQSYIAKIEGGERRLDILEFVALAKAMDIDPTTLFADVVRGIKDDT